VEPKEDDLERRLAEPALGSRGEAGFDMYALAEALAGAEDWDELLKVRHELDRRSRSEALAGSYQPGPAGLHHLTLSSPARRYAFGVSAFDAVLRRRGPAKFALPGFPTKLPKRVVLELTERFTWSELDPLVRAPVLREVLARERVARGEDLRHAGFRIRDSDPPMYLEPWEPATYADPGENMWASGLVPRIDPLPPAGDATWATTLWATPLWATPLWATPLGATDPDPVAVALTSIAKSGDQVSCVRVTGTALEAIEALGYDWAYAFELSVADMLAEIAYGAWHSIRQVELIDMGRRFAWRVLSTVASAFTFPAGMEHSERLRLAGERVRWISFDSWEEDEDGGDASWEDVRRCLAIEDPVQGLAWAMTAVGSVEW
jgi:hypothetical protein